MKTQTLSLLCAMSALAIAGCGGGGSSEPAPAQPQPQPQPQPPPAESFTNWSKTGVYAKPAEGVPENMDTLVWNFDGDNDPNAYAELLPPES